MRLYILTALTLFTLFNTLTAQNNCLHFDGIDDQITLPGFTISGDLTMSAWIRPNIASNSGDDNRVLSFGPQVRLEIGMADNNNCEAGQLWIYDQSAGTQDCWDDISLNDGDWHQIALTIAGATRSVYVDGTLLGTFEGAPSPTYMNMLRIGAWTGGSNSNTRFAGSIDEVRVYDRALSTDEIVETLNCELDGDEDGLIIYYTFNQGIAGGNNAGETMLLDKTANENHASLGSTFSLSGNNSNWISSEAVENGLCNPITSDGNHCLHFDGNDDQITLSDLTMSGDLTMSAWIKPDATSNGGDDNRVLSFGPQVRLELGMADNNNCDAGQLWLYDQSSGTQECWDDVALNDGDWHQIALTIAGTTRSVYVDGALVGTFEGTAAPTYMDALRIGAWTGGSNSNTRFQGMIDEVRIYERALAEAELAETLNCELNGDEDGLIVYYTFNQGIAGGNNAGETMLLDKTTNANHATLGSGFSLNGQSSNWVVSGAVQSGDCTPNRVKNVLNTAFDISPNPTNSRAIITNTDGLTGTIYVLNLNGQLVSQQPLQSTNTIDLDNQSAGVYFVRVHTEAGQGVYKLVKI